MNINLREMVEDFFTGIGLSYIFIFTFSSIIEWSFNWNPESWGQGRILFSVLVFWCFAATFVRFKEGRYDKEDV